jgi:hypothetical protein
MRHFNFFYGKSLFTELISFVDLSLILRLLLLSFINWGKLCGVFLTSEFDPHMINKTCGNLALRL